MTALPCPSVLALCTLLAGPAVAQGWWLESQQGDTLRIVPQRATGTEEPADRPVLCLHDLTGNGRKGFSLAEGPAPQFVAEIGASVCTDTVARPLVVYLWRETGGRMAEVLRLPLRAGDLRGTGLRIDWLTD